MKKEKNSKKNVLSVIAFVLLAAVLIVFIYIVQNMLENNESDTDSNPSDTKITETSTEKETDSDSGTDAESGGEADAETAAETPVQTEPVATAPPHQSQTQLEISEYSTELNNLGIVLDKNKNKTYKFDLRDFAEPGDNIESFTFYIRSEDEASALGEVKGGYGISVDNSCPLATENVWYQCPDDFAIVAEGNSLAVTWTLSPELRDYILISGGKVLFGYWWSDVDTVVLDRVTCHKTTLKEIPWDADRTVKTDRVLKNAAPENVLTVPVSELFGDNEMLQSVTVEIEAAEPVTNIISAFSINTNTLFNGNYRSKDMYISGDSEKIKIIWILPDAVKNAVNREGNLEFDILGCNVPEVNVKKITARYNILADLPEE